MHLHGLTIELIILLGFFTPNEGLIHFATKRNLLQKTNRPNFKAQRNSKRILFAATARRVQRKTFLAFWYKLFDATVPARFPFGLPQSRDKHVFAFQLSSIFSLLLFGITSLYIVLYVCVALVKLDESSGES